MIVLEVLFTALLILAGLMAILWRLTRPLRLAAQRRYRIESEAQRLAAQRLPEQLQVKWLSWARPWRGLHEGYEGKEAFKSSGHATPAVSDTGDAESATGAALRRWHCFQVASCKQTQSTRAPRLSPLAAGLRAPDGEGGLAECHLSIPYAGNLDP